MEVERAPDVSREFALQRDDGHQQSTAAVTGIKREAISSELVSLALDRPHCFERRVPSWRKFALGIVGKFENNFSVCTKYCNLIHGLRGSLAVAFFV